MKRIVLVPLSLLIVALLAAVVLYFFVIRQPDSNFETLSKSLSIIKDKGELVSKNVSSMGLPFFITQDSLNSYSKNLSELTTATVSVDSNPVIKNNKNLNKPYEEYKNNIQAYIASNNDLVSSINQYFKLSKVCGDMGYSLDSIRSKPTSLTISTFDTESKDCQATIAATATTPDEKFKKQFLSDYLLYMNSLIAAYRQEFSAAGNTQLLKSSRATIDATWNSIQLMSNGYLLDLTRSPDPTAAINALSTTTAEQKNAIFR